MVVSSTSLQLVLSFLGAASSVLSVLPENSTDENEIITGPLAEALQPQVYQSAVICVISQIVGWCYFVFWSTTFYPLMINNYKRKSVVGLNFDFLLFNIVGFLMYTIFNLGIYLIPEVKAEYSRRHPDSPSPVQSNDIFFSVNAVFSTVFTIYQCFIYEKGNQRVSTTGKCIAIVYLFLSALLVLLANLDVIVWLDVLYMCSYVKLWITFTKYIPQALMNYKRQSTGGFSIGTVFLDLFGGVLSILQMVLDSWNYSNWTLVIGNPTKCGLGVISIGFNLVFVFQHFVLYPEYSSIKGINN